LGPRNYSNALRHCEVLGGTLAMFKDAQSQLLVERYFGNSSAMLSNAYWIGVNRTDPLYPYTYMDGSYLSQTVSPLPCSTPALLPARAGHRPAAAHTCLHWGAPAGPCSICHTARAAGGVPCTAARP
jgi:hypothetical protein